MSERTVETLAYGSIFILCLLAVFGGLSWMIFSIATALILLGSASYQRRQGWQVSPFTWLFGGAFGVIAVLQIIGTVLRLALGMLWNVVVPLLVLGLVGWLAYRVIFQRRGG